MEKIDYNTFFDITSGFELVPYTQSRGMYDFIALSGKNRIRFFVNNIIKPTIACYGHEKSFGPKKMILIEGECYATLDKMDLKSVRSFFSEICLQGYDIVELCSNARYNFNYEIALRQAGYLRPVGQFSMPITKIINLTVEREFNKNWKRNSKKSLDNNLVFEITNQPKKTDCDDFVSIYREMTDRKLITISLTSNQIHALCNTDDFQLFFVSTSDTRIAGIIIHKTKIHAGLLFAATKQRALNLSASFFMYNALFDYLKQNGFQSFDMEKLVPSTKSVNSVFLFKNGIEGEHVQLNGEWSWYKKSYYRPLMYFVKKYLMKKREL